MESLIIGIAGGSGSGKSTFTNRIKKRFGDDVVVLYHDNYYRRQDGIPFEQRVTVNYDHPDSLETELLVEHLKLLRQGKAIDCPVYDYSKHNRSDKILHITGNPAKDTLISVSFHIDLNIKELTHSGICQKKDSLHKDHRTWGDMKV